MSNISAVKTEQEILGLYTSNPYKLISKPLVLNVADDFREVYIAECDGQKIVIKHTSNDFTDENRMNAMVRLPEVYNECGIYCPKMIQNREGELYSSYTVDDRNYFIYAEEVAAYEIAECIEEEKCNDANGIPIYYDKMFRSLGKIATACLDETDCPSVYAILTPFCPSDTEDEQTECAELFFNYIYENIPEFKVEADEIKAIFYDVKRKIAEAYSTLPTSCFQADLSISNILLDENYDFAGLIDFNLCGKDRNINYPIREALWKADIYENHDYLTLDAYEENDKKRKTLFMRNLRSIGEAYCFTNEERAVFPYIYNYADSIWWEDVTKITRIHDDRQKVRAYLGWIKKTLTRKDVQLP